MLAEIFSGEVDTADVFFLIAVVLFVVAVIYAFTRKVASYPIGEILVATGLAFVALGFLVL